MKRIYLYFLSIGIALDRLIAALIGWGHEYTISARCATTKRECRFCKVACWLLNYVDKDHCAKWAKREGAH